MKQLIYDLKECPEDIEMFTTNNWKLVGFEVKEYKVPQMVPSNAFLKKQDHNGQQFDDMWGRVELEGRVNIKLH